MKIADSVIFKSGNTQWLEPVQMSAGSVLRYATTLENLQGVLAVLKQLKTDDYLDYMIPYYETGMKRFGSAWGYSDLLTILRAVTLMAKPKNYLEIGVRRGRSAAVAAVTCPAVDIYGFDLWMQDYAGMENPGPDFVANELKSLGHKGNLSLISGDSQQTIPQFFQEHPDLYFDMMTVDGDHSEMGARIDLENCLSRLKLGGVILLDDIVHPQHRYLETLWDELITNNDNFSSMKYSELGYGIAFAIRRSF